VKELRLIICSGVTSEKRIIKEVSFGSSVDPGLGNRY
jgi:hypothetical protein